MDTPELWLAGISGSELLDNDHVGLCESSYHSVRCSASEAYLDDQRLRKLVGLLERKLSRQFVLYGIIIRLAVIIIDLGSIKNGVFLVERSKGMGVVTAARVIRRR
jgi:hypothetical protein